MDSTFRLWIAIFISGAVTFAIRYFFFMSSETGQTGKKKEILAFIPPATFAALSASEIFHDGIASVSISNPYMWAGAAALFAALKFKNTFVTITAGMTFIWLWNFCNC